MSIRLDDLTIVLPTRNEAHNIRTFLDSIPSSVMLIVIDASEDDTPSLIIRHRPQRTMVVRHQSTVTEARQMGAELAKTRWLLFTDADVIFQQDYFERLARYRAYNVIYGEKLSRDNFHRYYEWFRRGQSLLHSLGIPAASGSNLLMKRTVLMALGGFDLRLNCNEDSELAWRAKRNGYTTVFAPDLVVYAQDHRRLRWGLMRKTLHSLVRCSLLYLGLMPARWRAKDWGYWSQCPAKSNWNEEPKNGVG